MKHRSLLDGTGIFLKYIGLNVVTAKDHGGAIEHDRQAKETDKPCLWNLKVLWGNPGGQRQRKKCEENLWVKA